MKLLYLGAALCAVLTGPSWADEPSPAASTDAATVSDVIVVGRGQRPITVQPRGLSVSLGQAEFDAVNAVNVEDLMKYAPNFFVRKRYIGDANGVPGFRGTHSVQSARTLVMVDGFVISNFLGNSFSFPPKWGVVGPGDVEQFDIVYGPYSARYNGHSMGGIVSITTREPEGNEAFASAQVFRQAYKQYGTDDSYDGYVVEGGVGFKQDDGPWSGRLSFRRLDNTGHPQQFSQLVAATGPATPVTGAVVDPNLISQTPVAGAYAPDHTLQDQLRGRVGFDLGAGWKAEALGVLWTTRSDATQPQTYLTDADGAPVFDGPVRFEGATYNAGTGLGLSLGDKRESLVGLRLEGLLAGWKTRLNLSRYNIGRQDIRASTTYTSGIANGAGTFTRQNDVGWTTADIESERAFGAHTLAVGLDANAYETAQESFNVTEWRMATGQTFLASTAGKTTLSGVFAEDEIALSDTVRLTLGARYDRWRAAGGSVGRLVAGSPMIGEYAPRQDDAVSPKISLQWDGPGEWQTQLSLATATRFPTVGELFQGRLDAAGDFDPNSFDPNLKAEKSHDANLIVRRRFEGLRLTGSLFYQNVNDALFQVSGFNQNGLVTNSYKNIDEVRQYGAEAIAEWTDLFVPGLDLDANLAWTDSRTVRNAALPVSQGVRFPRIPKWRANANLRYRLSDDLKLSVGLRYASRPNTNLEGTQRGDTYGYTSEFFIIDTRLTWDIDDRWQASLGVDNVGNDKAWVFHPYPQRTAVAELKWKL